MHRDRIYGALARHSGRYLECHAYDGITADSVIKLCGGSSMTRKAGAFNVDVIERGYSSWTDDVDKVDIVVCEIKEPDDAHSRKYGHAFGYDVGAQVLVAATSERGQRGLGAIRSAYEGGYDGWYDDWGLDYAHLAEDIIEVPVEWLSLADTQEEDGTAYCELRRLFELLDDHGLREAIEQVRDQRYDVGCVGIYTVVNYGAHLTYYALYHAIRDLGYSVVMIDPPLDTLGRAQDVPPLFDSSPYPEWAQLERFPNMAEMKRLNRMCHTFVSGSDQMWNNQLWREFCGFQALPFVTDDHPKIAYAASAGHDRIWGEDSDRATQAYFLAKFDAVSVREDSAVELFRREFGVPDAQQVLDPVFFLPMEKYDEFAEPYSMKSKAPYLFAYVLEPSCEKEETLRRCAQGLGVQGIYALTDSDETTAHARISAWDIPTITDAPLEFWVCCIWNASFVVADSFHGICLSILFHKPFVAIVNKERGETRFTSLLTTFNLMDRLAYSFDDIDRVMSLPPIDWDAVDGILATEKERSLGWLRKALEDGRDTTKRAASTYDVLDARVDELWLHADRGYYESAGKLREAERQLQEMRRELDAVLARPV